MKLEFGLTVYVRHTTHIDLARHNYYLSTSSWWAMAIHKDGRDAYDYVCALPNNIMLTMPVPKCT